MNARLSVWTAVPWARAKAWASTRYGVIACALLAGAGPALAPPPFGFTPGLLGFALLLRLLDGADAVRPLRSAFWRAWLAGLAYFYISTSWVGEAFQVDAADHGWQAPFAVGFLAGGLALLFGTSGLAYRWLAPQGARRVLVFAAVFALEEWVRGHFLTGFPWDLMGEAWRAGSPMSQGAALVGAYGLTLFTLILAAAPALLFDRVSRRSRAWSLGGAFALFLALWSYGAVRLALARPANSSVLVRIVQADIDQKDKWKPENLASILGAYGRLTAAPAARRPDLIIWPEGAIPASMNDYLAPNTWTRIVVEQALSPGQTLLLGGYREVDSASGPRFYNSLVALRRTGAGVETVGVYDKYRLVPFGEYFPMDHLADVLGLKKLVHVGDGFSAGPRPRPLKLPGLPAVQPLICYESLFPSLPEQDILRPQAIVNISNDAWFGATSGPLQHLNIASYRAIETGLPMLRATPTGVSAVIDPYGRALATLPHGAKAVLDAPLPAPAAPPLYGLIKDRLFFILTTLVLIVSIPPRFYVTAKLAASGLLSRILMRRSPN
jgi:apolipoprotein N-acyltransferase